MSECIIVVDQNNCDSNSIKDLAAAVGDVGAVTNVDESQHIIQATLPAHEVPVVKEFEGVSYVRCVFNFFCGQPPRRAA